MEDDQDNINAGDDGAASSAVKTDVTPETHYADEKGVPYYNRFREMEEKLKGFEGVDLDLYGRAKELDLDEVEEALQFKALASKDQGKLQQILSILRDEKKAATSPAQKSAAEERIERLERHIQGKEQASWMERYDSSVESSLNDSMKNEAFKDLGGKLTEFERSAVIKLVDDVFQADAAKGRLSKLSHNNIPDIVQGILKKVVDNRKGTLGGMVKRDQSPEPINGSGATGREKPKPMTDEQRIESMRNFMKEHESGKVPTV